MKTCSKCKEEKDYNAFSKNRLSKDGYQSECKSCKNAYGKKHRKDKGSQFIRAKRLEKDFSISIEEYNIIFIEQHGVCSICNKAETRLNNKGQPHYLAVDHNHNTGEVRGLLCSACNRGLGLLGDNPRLLKSALNYLETRGYYGKDE